ncbi:MAG: hypothetical protein R8K20_11680 [Gallionellaceae bacterium]
MKSIYSKKMNAKYDDAITIRADHPDDVAPGVSIDLGAVVLILGYENAKELSKALAEAYGAMEAACEVSS